MNTNIKCPYCNYEYLPAEIYVSRSFFGNPRNILRDEKEFKIIDFQGESMDLKEDYRCDNCNKLFKINAKISFITQRNEAFNFDDDYKTDLNQISLFLDEQ